MAKEILISSIVDPAIQQPFTGKSLQFLQQWNTDSSIAIFRAIIGDALFGTGPGPWGICALRDTGTHPVVNIAAGFILYDSELYFCTGYAGTLTGSNVIVAAVNSSFDSSIDPVLFTDLVPRSVHNVRTIVLSQGVSGSALFDYTDIYFIQGTPDTWHTPTFLNSWTTPTAFQYRKDGNTVTIRGRVTNTGSIVTNVFTLPVGYRPTAETGILSFVAGALDDVHTGVIDTGGNVTISSAVGGTNKTLIVYLTFTLA